MAYRFNAITGDFDLVDTTGGGVTDHGALTGLLDDDHPQYLLLAGRAGATNNPIISTTITGVITGSTQTLMGLTLVPNSADTTGKIGIMDPSLAFFERNAFGDPALILGPTDPSFDIAGANVANLGIYDEDSCIILQRSDTNIPRFVQVSLAEANDAPAYTVFRGRGASWAGRTQPNTDDGMFVFAVNSFKQDQSPMDDGAGGFGYEADQLFTDWVSVRLGFSIMHFDGTRKHPLYFFPDTFIQMGNELADINTRPADRTLQVQSVETDRVTATFLGLTGQTASLSEWRDETDDLVAAISAAGQALVTDGVTQPAFNTFFGNPAFLGGDPQMIAVRNNGDDANFTAMSSGGGTSTLILGGFDGTFALPAETGTNNLLGQLQFAYLDAGLAVQSGADLEAKYLGAGAVQLTFKNNLYTNFESSAVRIGDAALAVESLEVVGNAAVEDGAVSAIFGAPRADVFSFIGPITSGTECLVLADGQTNGADLVITADQDAETEMVCVVTGGTFAVPVKSANDSTIATWLFKAKSTGGFVGPTLRAAIDGDPDNGISFFEFETSYLLLKFGSEFRFQEPGGGTDYTSFKAQAQAGTIDYTLPAAIVTNGFLRTDAAGVLSWSTAPVLQAYSTVQEEGVALTQRSILNFIGGGFTAADDAGNSRTNVTLDATLNALAAYNTNGFLVQTAADTFAGRTLTSANALLTITNPAGTAGDPVFTVVNSAIDHGALAGLTDDDHSQYAYLAGRTGTTNDLTITTSNNGIGSIYGGSDDGATLELNASSSGSAHTGFIDAIDIFRVYQRVHVWPTGVTIDNDVLSPSTSAEIRHVSAISIGQDGITLTGDFPQIRAVDFSGAVTFDAQNALGTGFLFNHAATYANSGAVNFGNVYTLVDNYTLLPTNTAALTMSEMTTVRSTPTITSVSTGTLTVSNLDTVVSRPTINTGNTATTRRGLRFRTHLGSGTIENAYGLHAEAITATTLVAAVRSEITASSAVRWFLQSTGNAPSSFGGPLYIGSTTLTVPSARLHVDEITAISDGTIGSEVLRLETQATNDNPNYRVFHGRQTTTSATVATLLSFTIPATTTVLLEARVVARRTGGTAGTAEDAAAYIIKAAVKNVAGTATLVTAGATGSPTVDFDNNDQAGWNATIDVTGATARVRVTGATDNNITWHCALIVQNVTS